MPQRWIPAYVALGSNLQEPRAQVIDAFSRLSALRDTRLELRSKLYLTKPLGPQDQPAFVNAAAGLLTRLSASDLLEQLLCIERDMGRIRGERWGPRLIDLDLLCMTGTTINITGLTLPHPGVSERNFVLYPLNDIAPTLLIADRGCVSELMARVGADGLSVLE